MVEFGTGPKAPAAGAPKRAPQRKSVGATSSTRRNSRSSTGTLNNRPSTNLMMRRKGSLTAGNGLSAPVLLPLGDGVISNNVKHQEEDYLAGKRCVLMKYFEGSFILQYRDLTKIFFEGASTVGDWKSAPPAIPIYHSENDRQNNARPAGLLISPLDQNCQVAEFRFYSASNNNSSVPRRTMGSEKQHHDNIELTSDIVGPVFTHINAPSIIHYKVNLKSDLTPAGVEVTFKLNDLFETFPSELVPKYAQARYRILSEGDGGLENSKILKSLETSCEWVPSPPFLHASDATIPSQFAGCPPKENHIPPDKLTFSYVFRDIPFGAKCQFQVRFGSGLRWSPWSKLVPKNGWEIEMQMPIPPLNNSAEKVRDIDDAPPDTVRVTEIGETFCKLEWHHFRIPPQVSMLEYRVKMCLLGCETDQPNWAEGGKDVITVAQFSSHLSELANCKATSLVPDACYAVLVQARYPFMGSRSWSDPAFLPKPLRTKSLASPIPPAPLLVPKEFVELKFPSDVKFAYDPWVAVMVPKGYLNDYGLEAMPFNDQNEQNDGRWVELTDVKILELPDSDDLLPSVRNSKEAEQLAPIERAKSPAVSISPVPSLSNFGSGFGSSRPSKDLQRGSPKNSTSPCSSFLSSPKPKSRPETAADDAQLPPPLLFSGAAVDLAVVHVPQHYDDPDSLATLATSSNKESASILLRLSHKEKTTVAPPRWYSTSSRPCCPFIAPLKIHKKLMTVDGYREDGIFVESVVEAREPVVRILLPIGKGISKKSSSVSDHATVLSDWLSKTTAESDKNILKSKITALGHKFVTRAQVRTRKSNRYSTDNVWPGTAAPSELISVKRYPGEPIPDRGCMHCLKVYFGGADGLFEDGSRDFYTIEVRVGSDHSWSPWASIGEHDVPIPPPSPWKESKLEVTEINSTSLKVVLKNSFQAAPGVDRIRYRLLARPKAFSTISSDHHMSEGASDVATELIQERKPAPTREQVLDLLAEQGRLEKLKNDSAGFQKLLLSEMKSQSKATCEPVEFELHGLTVATQYHLELSACYLDCEPRVFPEPFSTNNIQPGIVHIDQASFLSSNRSSQISIPVSSVAAESSASSVPEQIMDEIVHAVEEAKATEQELAFEPQQETSMQLNVVEVESDDPYYFSNNNLTLRSTHTTSCGTGPPDPPIPCECGVLLPNERGVCLEYLDSKEYILEYRPLPAANAMIHSWFPRDPPRPQPWLESWIRVPETSLGTILATRFGLATRVIRLPKIESSNDNITPDAVEFRCRAVVQAHPGRWVGGISKPMATAFAPVAVAPKVQLVFREKNWSARLSWRVYRNVKPPAELDDFDDHICDGDAILTNCGQDPPLVGPYDQEQINVSEISSGSGSLPIGFGHRCATHVQWRARRLGPKHDENIICEEEENYIVDEKKRRRQMQYVGNWHHGGTIDLSSLEAAKSDTTSEKYGDRFDVNLSSSNVLNEGVIYEIQVRVGDQLRWSAWSEQSNSFKFSVPILQPLLCQQPSLIPLLQVETISASVVRLSFPPFLPQCVPPEKDQKIVKGECLRKIQYLLQAEPVHVAESRHGAGSCTKIVELVHEDEHYLSGTELFLSAELTSLLPASLYVFSVRARYSLIGSSWFSSYSLKSEPMTLDDDIARWQAPPAPNVVPFLKNQNISPHERAVCLSPAPGALWPSSKDYVLEYSLVQEEYFQVDENEKEEDEPEQKVSWFCVKSLEKLQEVDKKDDDSPPRRRRMSVEEVAEFTAKRTGFYLARLPNLIDSDTFGEEKSALFAGAAQRVAFRFRARNFADVAVTRRFSSLSTPATTAIAPPQPPVLKVNFRDERIYLRLRFKLDLPPGSTVSDFKIKFSSRCEYEGFLPPSSPKQSPWENCSSPRSHASSPRSPNSKLNIAGSLEKAMINTEHNNNETTERKHLLSGFGHGFVNRWQARVRHAQKPNQISNQNGWILLPDTKIPEGLKPGEGIADVDLLEPIADVLIYKDYYEAQIRFGDDKRWSAWSKSSQIQRIFLAPPAPVRIDTDGIFLTHTNSSVTLVWPQLRAYGGLNAIEYAVFVREVTSDGVDITKARVGDLFIDCKPFEIKTLQNNIDEDVVLPTMKTELRDLRKDIHYIFEVRARYPHVGDRNFSLAFSSRILMLQKNNTNEEILLSNDDEQVFPSVEGAVLRQIPHYDGKLKRFEEDVDTKGPFCLLHWARLGVCQFDIDGETEREDYITNDEPNCWFLQCRIHNCNDVNAWRAVCPPPNRYVADESLRSVSQMPNVKVGPKNDIRCILIYSSFLPKLESELEVDENSPRQVEFRLFHQPSGQFGPISAPVLVNLPEVHRPEIIASSTEAVVIGNLAQQGPRRASKFENQRRASVHEFMINDGPGMLLKATVNLDLRGFCDSAHLHASLALQDATARINYFQLRVRDMSLPHRFGYEEEDISWNLLPAQVCKLEIDDRYTFLKKSTKDVVCKIETEIGENQGLHWGNSEGYQLQIRVGDSFGFGPWSIASETIKLPNLPPPAVQANCGQDADFCAWISKNSIVLTWVALGAGKKENWGSSEDVEYLLSVHSLILEDVTQNWNELRINQKRNKTTRGPLILQRWMSDAMSSEEACSGDSMPRAIRATMGNLEQARACRFEGTVLEPGAFYEFLLVARWAGFGNRVGGERGVMRKGGWSVIAQTRAQVPMRLEERASLAMPGMTLPGGIDSPPESPDGGSGRSGRRLVTSKTENWG